MSISCTKIIMNPSNGPQSSFFHQIN
jgi:hypothetical protein